MPVARTATVMTLPDTAGVEVIPRDDTGTGVSRADMGGEAVLPFPGRSCAGVGARQRQQHGDRNGTVHLLQAADPLPVGAEALEPPLLVWENGYAIAGGRGVATGDAGGLTIAVLATQAQRCEPLQAAAVEKAGDTGRRAIPCGADAQAFVMAEGGLDGGAVLRVQGVPIAEGTGRSLSQRVVKPNQPSHSVPARQSVLGRAQKAHLALSRAGTEQRPSPCFRTPNHPL
jgi:hypothetical protein